MDKNDIRYQRSVSDSSIQIQSKNPNSIGDGIEKADDGNTGEKGRQYNLRSRYRVNLMDTYCPISNT